MRSLWARGVAASSRSKEMERIRNKQHSTGGTRMSDTPRTDEQAGYPDGSGCWKYTELGLYVDADFARQLERENARLRSELEAAMEDGYSPRLPNPHDD